MVDPIEGTAPVDVERSLNSRQPVVGVRIGLKPGKLLTKLLVGETGQQLNIVIAKTPGIRG